MENAGPLLVGEYSRRDGFEVTLFQIATVEVAGVDLFVAGEKLREGRRTDGVVFEWRHTGFEDCFYNKVETDVAPATLRVHTFDANVPSSALIAKLGTTCEVALAHVWGLLTKQCSGREGALLVDGWGTIAHVRSTEGILMAMRVFWRAEHQSWRFLVRLASDPRPWLATDRVISH